jgi:beta-glucosidase/6-phospho-beta-glucosidase/beta-galactosidase
MTLDTSPSAFTWATGIEDTFIAHVRPGLRLLDEYALTQHYRFWRSDIDRAAAAGVSAIRWGIPWYRVQPAPNLWDWGWTDQVIDYIVNGRGLRLILDLVHYGTPLWLDNSFINARYPEWVAEYTAAAARRYKSLVQVYTPVNEPALNARWSGRRGEWPPYLRGDDGFVKVLLGIARGLVLATQALRAEQPEAQTVQVEAVGEFFSRDPALEARVARFNAEQYLSFDLCTGRVDDAHPLHGWLREHGAAEHDLAWFRQNAVQFDVFGANYYPWSAGALAAARDNTLYRRPGRTPGASLGQSVEDAHQRYGLPVMVTETSAAGPVERRARWMDETLEACRAARARGVPVIGYTWFPLFTLFDWKYRLGRRQLAHYALSLGLYDCEFDARGVFRRRKTPLVDRLRAHIQNWRG